MDYSNSIQGHEEKARIPSFSKSINKEIFTYLFFKFLLYYHYDTKKKEAKEKEGKKTM